LKRRKHSKADGITNIIFYSTPYRCTRCNRTACVKKEFAHPATLQQNRVCKKEFAHPATLQQNRVCKKEFAHPATLQKNRVCKKEFAHSTTALDVQNRVCKKRLFAHPTCWATGCGEIGNNGPHQLDVCRRSGTNQAGCHTQAV